MAIRIMADKIDVQLDSAAKLLLWAGKQFTKTKFCYYLNPMKSLCNLARLSLAAGQGVPPPHCVRHTRGWGKVQARILSLCSELDSAA